MNIEVKELSNYKIILEKIPMYIAELDLDMNILWLNQYALDQVGQVKGKKCYESFNLDYEQCTFCPVGRSISSKKTEVSLVSIDSDPSSIFEISAIPFFGHANELASIFEIRKDVTLQLEHQKNKTDLQSSPKKDIFSTDDLIDIVTAELRILVSNSINLNDSILTSVNKRQNIEMTHLKSTLSKVNNVLENIDIIRGIDKGILKNHKKKFDLKDIILDLFNQYHGKTNINGNNFDYKYDSFIPNKLILDKTKVSLILSNIIDYAMNSSTNRSINLIITIVEELQENVKVNFKIKNIGSILIHDKFKADYNHCFQSNLALSVVKNLVEDQGGDLKIVPVSGYGIDVEIILSFKKTFRTSTFPIFSRLSLDYKSSLNKKNDKKHKILIAEDDAVCRVNIDQILKREYDIIFAKNGKIAVEKYIKESPDLVIMDIMMPVMNGFDAYDQIERNNINRVPIIACTAKVIKSEREYLKSYGFDDYIAKPINIKNLKDIINKYLS